jgi:septal ring factor EnvC (AmiA/AmiB activator)
VAGAGQPTRARIWTGLAVSLISATLCFAWLPAAVAETPGSDAEIESLRQEIEASRTRVVAHEREERDLLQLLEEIDRGVERLRNEVRLSELRAEQAQSDLADVEQRLAGVRKDLAATRSAMARRAVALYKTGEVGPLRVLFASVDLKQMMSKMWTLERLIRYDNGLVARFEREQSRLLVIEEEAVAAVITRDEARARFASRNAMLDEERAARRAVLVRVRGDRSQERTLLIELERAARALEETLAGLGGADIPVADLDGRRFEASRGRLARPVKGEIRGRFGRVLDDEYLTETFRNGIEIAATPGDSVRAVARGQVRYAGWFRGYGKIVIVDHGGGYFTVSGHLSDIFVEVGDVVEGADTLGSVGDTGSLRGAGLYFEMRSGAQPLDPADWLTKG